MAADPVTTVAGAVIAWLIGQLGAAGKSGLSRMIVGDKQQKALRQIVREAIEAAAGEVADAEVYVLSEALLLESPDEDRPAAADVLDLKSALNRQIARRLDALADQGYVYDADQLVRALTRHVQEGIQANAVRDGPLKPMAEFLRHKELVTATEQVTVELREANRAPDQASREGHSRPPVPRQLPATPVDFTGRVQELSELAVLCASTHSPDSAAAATIVISGPAGVGKSAFALRLSHSMIEGYPDGQLYCSLRAGHGRLTPGVVLASFLRALGVAAADIPQEPGEQAAMFRTLLYTRRVLILLDNATNEAQVRLLLPSDSRCLVIVTSRNPLPGLEGATPYQLGLVDPDEALALLARIAGPEKIHADPEASASIVRLCGRLPLAMRIAAAKMRVRQDWSAAYLADRLSDAHRRLKELRVGDLDVRASVELSYLDLDADAARLFRLLPAAPGPTFSVELAAALAGLPEQETDDLLNLLTFNQLVEPAGPGRYQMHELIGLVGAQLFTEIDLVDEAPVDPLMSVLTWYVKKLDNVFGGLVVRPGMPNLPDAVADARAWLDAEETGLLDLFRFSEQEGIDEYTALIAHPIGVLAQYRGLWGIRQTVLDAGLVAARRLGDDRQTARLLFERGEHATDWEQSWDDAVTYWTEALTLIESANEPALAASMHHRLAQAYRALGRPADAEREIAASTAVAATAAADPLDAQTLEASFRATDHLKAGQYREALKLLEPVEPSWKTTQPRVEVPLRLQLAEAYKGLRQYTKEVKQLIKCRELCHEYGLRSHQLDIALRLGIAYRSRGRHARARDTWAEALASPQASANAGMAARLAYELAKYHARAGDPAAACELFTQSAEAFTAAGQYRNRAGALHELALNRLAIDDRKAAAAALADALTGLKNVENQELAEHDRQTLEETRSKLLGPESP